MRQSFAIPQGRYPGRTLIVLLAAALLFGCAPPPSPTPTAIPSPVPTDTSTPLPAPTATPTIVLPTRTPLPTVTPAGSDSQAEATPFAANPDIAEGVPPPFDITLPSNWQEGFSILPVRDGITQNGVPVAIYTGSIPEHPDITGWVVVMWGYPSISATGQPDPWADGLRFLRGALLDASCNIGTDLTRYFSVGGRDDAIGTYFQAVGCRGEPDTAGWFAGLNVAEQGGNYVFFVYVEPLDGFYDSQPALQAILDSISWHPVPTLTPES